MIKKEEIMELSKEFDNENSALVYAESKNGVTELILSGGGVAIFYVLYCVVKRLATLRGTTVDDAMDFFNYLVGTIKETDGDAKEKVS